MTNRFDALFSLLYFVVSSVVAAIIVSFCKLLDGHFIGNYAEADAMAAMNMSWPLVGCVSGIALMIGIGTGAANTIANAKIDSTVTVRDNSYIIQFFWLVLILTIAMPLLYFFGFSFFMNLQAAEETTKIVASNYLLIIFIFVPVVITIVALPIIVRNLGAPLRSTFYIATGAVINILFDYLFIVKLEFGLRGAAMATILANLVASAFSLNFIIKKCFINSEINWKLDIKKMYEIITIGFSSFIRYIYLIVIIVLYNRMLMDHGGRSAVSAYAAIGYIVTIVNIFTEGINNGIQPLISKSFGSKNITLLKKYFKAALLLGLTLSSVISLIAIFSPSFLANIFTSDENNLDITTNAIKLSLFLIFLDVFIYMLINFFQSINKPLQATIIAMSNMLIRIPILFILTKFLKLNGIWLSSPIATLIVFSISIYILNSDRKNKEVFI